MSLWFKLVLSFILLFSFLTVSLQTADSSLAAGLNQAEHVLIAQYLPGSDKQTGVDVSKLIDDKTGADAVVTAVRVGVYTKVKQLLSPILVILIGYFGISMMIAGGKEEEFKKATNHFFYLLVGIGFVFLADFFSQTFLLSSGGETGGISFLSNEQQLINAAKAFSDRTSVAIKFLRYVLGGIAFFFVVKSGSVIIFNAEEENVNKQKEVFMYGFVGLLLVMIAEALVNVVFDVNTMPGVPKLNITGGLSLIGNVTNLFLAGLSSLFLFTLVIGGVMYALSAGNEERGQKATKVIIGSLFGLVIAFSSYTIVYEFSRGSQIDQTFLDTTKFLSPGSDPAAP